MANDNVAQDGDPNATVPLTGPTNGGGKTDLAEGPSAWKDATGMWHLIIAPFSIAPLTINGSNDPNAHTLYSAADSIKALLFAAAVAALVLWGGRHARG